MEEKRYQPIWQENYPIDSYGIDYKSQLRFNLLTAIIQDAAWKHAEHLDYGYEQMSEQGLAWMLSRMLLKMKRIPKWTDTLRIETWPKGLERLFYLRDFNLYDQTGELIGQVTSYWLLVNMKVKRPVLDPHGHDIFKLNERKHALDTKLDKLPAVDPEISKELNITYSDLDINHHVNSNRYVEWMLDMFPLEFHKKHLISEFQIEYLHEVRYGEKVNLSYQKTAEDSYLMEGRINNNIPGFRARIVWTTI